MKHRMPVCMGWLLAALLFLPAQASAQQAAGERPHLTLEDVHFANTFSGNTFRGGRWADAGPVVWYIERDDSGPAIWSAIIWKQTNACA